nr:reverse transcriptase N-terminal domain-containing protein [Pleurocapsa sp. FMAR1]
MTHSNSYSDNWEFADWKGFQKVLFRLQRRIFKAVKVGDKARAKRLQKLVLSSHSARMFVSNQASNPVEYWQENGRD